MTVIRDVSQGITAYCVSNKVLEHFCAKGSYFVYGQQLYLKLHFCQEKPMTAVVSHCCVRQLGH